MSLSRKATFDRIARSPLAVPDSALFAAKDTSETSPVSLRIVEDRSSVNPKDGCDRSITLKHASLGFLWMPLRLCIDSDFIGWNINLSVGHGISFECSSKDIDTSASASPCGTYRSLSAYYFQSMRRAAIAASAEMGDKV